MSYINTADNKRPLLLMHFVSLIPFYVSVSQYFVAIYIEFVVQGQISDLRDHNENKAFLPVLCYPSHC